MSEKKNTRPYFVDFCGETRCIEAKSREAAREHLVQAILPAIDAFKIADAVELGRFMANGGKYEIAGQEPKSIDRVIVALSPAHAAMLASMDLDFMEALEPVVETRDHVEGEQDGVIASVTTTQGAIVPAVEPEGCPPEVDHSPEPGNMVDGGREALPD